MRLGGRGVSERMISGLEATRTAPRIRRALLPWGSHLVVIYSAGALFVIVERLCQNLAPKHVSNPYSISETRNLPLNLVRIPETSGVINSSFLNSFNKLVDFCLYAFGS